MCLDGFVDVFLVLLLVFLLLLRLLVGLLIVVSFTLGNVVSMLLGFYFNLLNFFSCFLFSDLLSHGFFDKFRSECDGGFSSFFTLADGLSFFDMVSDGFLGDLLSNFSSDSSQLFEFVSVLGCLFGSLSNSNDDAAFDRCLDSVEDGLLSLVIDVVGDFLECLLDGFLTDLDSFVSDLLLFAGVELVGIGSLLGKFQGNFSDLAVNLSLDFLNNLFDLLLVVLDLGGDVLRDDTAGDDVFLVGDLHAALRHEDSLFGSERLGIGGITLGMHSLEFSLVEVTIRLSEDRGHGLDGLFEGLLCHLGLLHEAHGILTHSDVSPDRVVPGFSSELKDSSDGVRLFLRTVGVVLFLMSVIKSLLDSSNLMLNLFNAVLNSLDSRLSSVLGTAGFSFG